VAVPVIVMGVIVMGVIVVGSLVMAVLVMAVPIMGVIVMRSFFMAVVVTGLDRFFLMPVVMGVFGRMGTVFREIAEFCAFDLQQGQSGRAFAKAIKGAIKPWGEFRADPNHEFGLCQTCCLRGAELEFMFTCPLRQKQFRRAQIAHHLRHEGVDGVDVGDDAGHFGEGRKGGGEGGKGRGYDITHRDGPSCGSCGG
jgi:hypothetical protein